ncbi:MAG: IPT/TIG domain-containing protein [Acidobacteriota bacterium]
MRLRALLALTPAILLGQDALPRLTVAYFDSPSCPTGWEVYGPAAGRTILPVAPDSGVLAQVGRPLASGEDRLHTHSLSGSISTGSAGYFAAASCCNTSLSTGGTKTFSATTSTSSAGLPYVQMLGCQKRVEPAPAPIPAGMTIFYEGLSCPSGWTQDDTTLGRFPVGDDYPREGYGNSSLKPREDRLHTHRYNGSITLPAQNILALGGGAQGFAESGDYMVTGDTGAASTGFPYLQLLQCTKAAAGPPQISGVLNGASFTSNAIAPGQIVAIFGSNLGPEEGAGAQLSGDRLATEVEDVRVLFGGRKAPILYASSGQVNVQVPYQVSGTTNIQVVFLDRFSETLRVPVASAAPGLFALGAPRNDEVIAVLGSELASESKRVPLGEPFVLYATGEGLTNPGSTEGVPRGVPLAKPIQPVTVTVGGVEAILDYAGAAPGFVGLMQINARLAAGTPSGKVPIVLQIGSVASAPDVNLWVQ